jgi:hypothetical protein
MVYYEVLVKEGAILKRIEKRKSGDGLGCWRVRQISYLTFDRYESYTVM